MKTSKRHNNAIKVLVNAFFNGTLAKGICTACAVGNLVADGLGGKIIIKDNILYCDKINKSWGDLFSTSFIRINKSWGDLFPTSFIRQSYYKEFENKSYILDNIYATKYSISELMKIEFAFETNTKITYLNYDLVTKEEIMQDQYNGLVAVFKVLCEIEGIESDSYIKLLEYQNSN